MKFTAVFMAVPEGYIGFVEELASGTGDWKWYVHSRNQRVNE